jgi:hypothetical protein
VSEFRGENENGKRNETKRNENGKNEKIQKRGLETAKPVLSFIGGVLCFVSRNCTGRHSRLGGGYLSSQFERLNFEPMLSAIASALQL